MRCPRTNNIQGEPEKCEPAVLFEGMKFFVNYVNYVTRKMNKFSGQFAAH